MGDAKIIDGKIITAVAQLPYRTTDKSVVIALRVTPKGGANRVDGFSFDSAGRSFIKLRVTETAKKGKANDAVIKLLAREWQMARSSLAIVAGATNRNKKLEINGDPGMLSENLALWCEKAGISKAGMEDTNE